MRVDGIAVGVSCNIYCAFFALCGQWDGIPQYFHRHCRSGLVTAGFDVFVRCDLSMVLCSDLAFGRL